MNSGRYQFKARQLAVQEIPISSRLIFTCLFRRILTTWLLQDCITSDSLNVISSCNKPLIPKMERKGTFKVEFLKEVERAAQAKWEEMKVYEMDAPQQGEGGSGMSLK